MHYTDNSEIHKYDKYKDYGDYVEKTSLSFNELRCRMEDYDEEKEFNRIKQLAKYREMGY